MATNVPPLPDPAGAPPRKKTSPVVWILLGVAGFFVFVIVAVAAVGFFALHKAKQAGFDVSLLQKKPELAILKMAVAANPDAELVSIDESRGVATIRDKKTGKVITMNFEDIRKGRFTLEQEGKKATFTASGSGEQGSVEVTGPEGTTKFGGGAVKLPAWFPAYPGAKLGGFSTEGATGSSGGFGFQTSSSADNVIAFYEDELKKAGLKVEVTRHPAGAILNAESGGRKATVSAITAASGASVNGTFEEK